jgi:restriction system protein
MYGMSGAEFEQFVAQVFHENGHHAQVTKASGDYGVDLILNGEIAVQVKSYSSPVGPGAIQEVVAGRAVYNCSEAWVVTNSTFTAAAVTLARANGVRLIAGDELRWLVENPDQSADHRERYEAAQAEHFKQRIKEIDRLMDEASALYARQSGARSALQGTQQAAGKSEVAQPVADWIAAWKKRRDASS